MDKNIREELTALLAKMNDEQLHKAIDYLRFLKENAQSSTPASDLPGTVDQTK